jgi:hypothetical protein
MLSWEFACPVASGASVGGMLTVQPELDDNPDRLRWNAKYGAGFAASFDAHPLAVEALASLPGPPGSPAPPEPVLELASGPSGSVLFAAKAGHRVLAVDASDVALQLLADEAERRGLSGLITLVHADLRVWRPEAGAYSVALCTGYWDRDLFPAAARAVAPGGLLGWEAYTIETRRDRPSFPPAWCLADGEPASLLPPGWLILGQTDLPGAKRRLLARAPRAFP